MIAFESQEVEAKMTAPASALYALVVLAGVATAAPPPGGPPGAGPLRHGVYPGGGHGHWSGPSVRFHYGGPYWGGWGWPVYAWPGFYASSYYYPPRYYGPGYVPPYYVYGPPGVVASTGGVVYIEREAGTVSTQQPAQAQPPAAEAPAAAPPPAGTPWWYLCASPRGAYPYVRECPGGWERVPAVPPGQAK